jgi:DNA-binding transcriptional ArsR family regulator
MSLKPRVLTTAQLRCLASPAREDLFSRLRLLGKGSVGDLAEATGRSPEAVNYHVKALLKAELIVEVGRRKTERRPEAVFAPIGSQFRFPEPEENPDATALTRKAAVNGLRRVTVALEKAGVAAESQPELRDFLHLVRANIRLSKEDAIALGKLIDEAARFARERERPDGEPVMWASVLFPVV